MEHRWKALVIAPSVICVLIAVYTAATYLAMRSMGIPLRLGLPLVVRLAGVPLSLLGLGFLLWTFRHRRFQDVAVSTYLMMRGIVRGMSFDGSDRMEPLNLDGPHRHVRHPMYFGVIATFLGLSMLLDRTLILLVIMIFLLWFTLVVIPLEERELHALYGDEYRRYAACVPMIVPSLRARWPVNPL